MKELNPKSDLWSKIESRRDFENQLDGLVKKLPTKEPKTNLWDQIDLKLDQEKRVFPIWTYVSIAVSIVLIMAFGVTLYNVNKAPIKTETNLISVNSIPKKNISNEPEEELATTSTNEELKKIEETTNEFSKEVNKGSKRILLEPITVPNKPFLLPKQELKLISESNIILNNPKGKAVTMHKVSISWGLNEKKKIRTQFGSTYPDPSLTQQLGRASKNQNSIKIKFNKE
ncbi:hypothetical protein AAGF08_15755 [Algoriphagus sp. SE2]|uniref:hypothetical protein n=1 Tax=Algoriphagus sp. SE2 TaxID=3141536 RepID=UPI0031CD940A